MVNQISIKTWYGTWYIPSDVHIQFLNGKLDYRCPVCLKPFESVAKVRKHRDSTKECACEK